MSDMGRFLDVMFMCGVKGKGKRQVEWLCNVSNTSYHMRVYRFSRAFTKTLSLAMKQANVGFVVRPQSFLSSVSLTIRDT